MEDDDHKLIENWKEAWKFWSVRFDAIKAAMIAFALASPDVIVQLMALMPHWMQDAFPPLVVIGLFGASFLLRILKQKKLSDAGA